MPLLRRLIIEVIEDAIREGLADSNKDDRAVKAVIQAFIEAGWTPPEGFDG